MPRKLEGLSVAGFQIKLNDGSDYWKLTDAVKAIPNVNVTERTWDVMADEDLSGKDFVMCYSWGVATVFKAIARLKAAGKMPVIPVLIIIAGVPRGIGQCIEVSYAKGWQVPDEVKEAVCEQVNSFPVSWPIANEGPNRFNMLVQGIPGNDHVHVQNFPAVHESVVAVISAEAAALAA